MTNSLSRNGSIVGSVVDITDIPPVPFNKVLINFDELSATVSGTVTVTIRARGATEYRARGSNVYTVGTSNELAINCTDVGAIRLTPSGLGSGMNYFVKVMEA